MQIDKITIAVSDMNKMRHFYKDVFDVDFSKLEMAGYQLYTAYSGDLELMLCPKELAGVEANINTIQLRFVVDDVESCYQQAMKHKIVVITELQTIEGRLHASFRDPDGNSLEVVALKS